MTNKFSFKERFLLNCSGCDLSTMAECTSSEVRKYMLTGTCVLIPAVLSFFTGGYSIYIISKNIWAVACFAPVWAWIIFTIDRAIVANLKSNKITWSVLFRFLIAILISILISQPLELLIFKDVIKKERSLNLQNEKDNACNKIDSAINKKKKEIKDYNEDYNNKVNEFKDEIKKGDPTVGRKNGIGAVANKLDTLKEQYLRRINPEIDKLQKDIDTLKTECENKKNLIDKNDPEGLLGELELLYSLEARNDTVKFSIILISVFFLILELIPIINKLFGNSGKPDLYDIVKEKNNQLCINAHEGNALEKLKLFEKEQLLLVNERIQKIDLLIQKNSIKAASKDYKFYMQTIKASGEEIEQTESEIVKKIKNEAVREQLIAQILRLFFEFSNSIENTIKALIKKTSSDNPKS